ncbi:unnamed protein product [Phytophthora fragariaefolia]|uniref:Unnamed protein product n=1 Tax=Phytophthora fragariaefolia TaxID=1490495 RepID=A0A9W6X6Z0_9STRA|nr:unnamed protein product [Phytophthora fragariaefolia]
MLKSVKNFAAEDEVCTVLAERIAEEQRRLHEREEIRKKKKAEEERIANLENEERLVIAGIEKQLRLVGAFWTATMQLPCRIEGGALPVCTAVLSVRALEKTIVGLDDDVVLVGDSSAKIHGFDRKTKNLLFTSSWEDEADPRLALGTPLAMASTRCGRLLGEYEAVAVFGSQAMAMKRPIGLDLSHYHVVVCDTGNSRIAMFAKRGAFVKTIGRKGIHGGEFYDLRDVKLANVRKRAITRGIEDTGVANEQFEAIVADCGNYRVQILNERGQFLRQFSLLGNSDQVAFQHNQFATLRAEIEREYAALRQRAPILSGNRMDDIYSLANVLHPTYKLYGYLTSCQMDWRDMRSRFHHPFALAYAPSEREVVVVDRENSSVYTYNFDAAGCTWLQLPRNRLLGVCSVHSCLQLNFTLGNPGEQDRPNKTWLYVSDPQSHRIAVLDANTLNWQFFVGATTYGDQELCSNGFKPGELNHPTFLATYSVGGDEESGCSNISHPNTMLVVSDTGNHSLSVFDAQTGLFCGRIGEGFGHMDGFFHSPQGIAVWDNRLLYVADQCNHRVQVFDLRTRTFMRAFGSLGSSPGRFNFPTGIALCPALPQTPKCDFGSHRSDKIVVADAGNYRVQVLDLDGSAHLILDAKLTPFGHPLSAVGVWVQQRSGYILVSDVANRCVAIFTNCGNFLTSFGATGEVETRFSEPVGVIITPQHTGVDLLLVVDAGRCDISSFQLRL